MIWVCRSALTRTVANRSIVSPKTVDERHYNMRRGVGKAASLKILLPMIEESDHPRHKQRVPIAAEGVRLQVIDKTFDGVLQRLKLGAGLL